ncbi:hypothetical protein ACFV0B_34320 [Streptomyces xanthophaeus]|uniref:hypothetical protein n=1 Tax=Streptomyces xanthophaeus TaxID=67385 RepID=UPI00368BAFD3
MKSPDLVSGLPFLDAHELIVAAPVPTTWDSLNKWVARTHLGISSGFAHLVGTDPRTVTGTLPEEGSTFPGFTVAESVPCDRLTLMGRHRFAQYALIFVVSEHPAGTIIGARSHGLFPGFTGVAYRKLVIGSGGHRILVRRMLREIARNAERRHRG